MIITTHQTPDLDALASAFGLAWMLDPDEEVQIHFHSTPDLTVWHEPEMGRYVVDVGGGELDHHIHQADGSSSADRSTCAFTLCCEYVQHTGTPEQVRRAMALFARVAPAVQRQDTTGSITAPPDLVANVLGVGALVRRTVWRMQDDRAAASTLAPLLRDLFENEYVQWQATHAPLDILSRARIFGGGQVIGYEWTPFLGEAIGDEVLWTAIETVYPNYRVRVNLTGWRPPTGGSVVTWSRGIGAVRGSSVDVAALLARIESDLPNDLCAEIRRWHHEVWWCGTGNVKHPREDWPPPHLVEMLTQALHKVLEGDG